jgi:hypothetical protein
MQLGIFELRTEFHSTKVCLSWQFRISIRICTLKALLAHCVYRRRRHRIFQWILVFAYWSFFGSLPGFLLISRLRFRLRLLKRLDKAAHSYRGQVSSICRLEGEDLIWNQAENRNWGQYLHDRDQTSLKSKLLLHRHLLWGWRWQQ